MNEKIKCKICGELFTPKRHDQIYCSKKCRIKNDNQKQRDKNKQNNIKESPRNTFTYICSCCGKVLYNRYRAKGKHQFCDINCKNKYYSKNKKNAKCIECGCEFEQKNKNHLYCSDECKKEYKIKNPKLYTYVCKNCNLEYKTPFKKKKNQNNVFCSTKCKAEFKHKQNIEIRHCKYCNKEFETTLKNPKLFCNIKCQAKWQSEYLIGENANTYNHNYSMEERTVCCEYCGKSFIVCPTDINKRRFCSRRCNLLGNKLTSKPQQIINNVLDNIGEKYINEYQVKYYYIDNYLPNDNLFIEVMGDYWHCNSIKYGTIMYNTQKQNISKDKRKHTYIKNKYGKETLYLWECDIEDNIEMCKMLILEYIKRGGILKNYHSFNYILTKDNNLVLKQNLTIPYMDYNIKDILKIYKQVDTPQSA